ATYHLCRCGHSDDKPFCDGSHEAVSFEGEETAGHPRYRDNCKVYEGGEVNLLDNESLCASMRFCDRGKGVWQAAIDSADPASRDLAIEEACACAAGRLTIVKKDGTPVEQGLPQEISPIEDTAASRRGPLWVKGGVQLEGADGTLYEVRNRMTLCRCGESDNMPYCDISHMRCTHMEGFDD
ncbi:MAG: CDGSH iron-sulfur domain-containing protein, partial [Ruminococcaceae bacterium]|nr:CDGSH iron-sulfur domain-containing protein [Oscillospiraceae bacterium]